jgi:hypothetical protein
MPTVGMELTTAQTYTDDADATFVINRLLNDNNGDCILAFATLGSSNVPLTADNNDLAGFAKGCILMDQDDGTPYKNTGSNLIANFEAV